MFTEQQLEEKYGTQLNVEDKTFGLAGYHQAKKFCAIELFYRLEGKLLEEGIAFYKLAVDKIVEHMADSCQQHFTGDRQAFKTWTMKHISEALSGESSWGKRLPPLAEYDPDHKTTAVIVFFSRTNGNVSSETGIPKTSGSVFIVRVGFYPLIERTPEDEDLRMSWDCVTQL